MTELADCNRLEIKTSMKYFHNKKVEFLMIQSFRRWMFICDLYPWSRIKPEIEFWPFRNWRIPWIFVEISRLLKTEYLVVLTVSFQTIKLTLFWPGFQARHQRIKVILARISSIYTPKNWLLFLPGFLNFWL